MGVNVSKVESVIRALSPEKPAGLDGLALDPVCVSIQASCS